MANVRSIHVQRSDLHWQPTLLGALDRAPAIDSTFQRARRIALDAHAWVEHVAGWVDGDEELFEHIVEHAPWEHRTVRMYDRMVAEPRLTAWYGRALDGAPSLPILGAMAGTLLARYDRAFDSVGAALYRDGHDSVAWHADRLDPKLVEPVVAIVSLGSARTLRLRPRGGGTARRFPLLPGDLLVMGGATQTTWEHSVPKVARAGARISLQFRHST
jgi:alkylated DNA repair dioxygenase AlkB